MSFYLVVVVGCVHTVLSVNKITPRTCTVLKIERYVRIIHILVRTVKYDLVEHIAKEKSRQTYAQPIQFVKCRTTNLIQQAHYFKLLPAICLHSL